MRTAWRCVRLKKAYSIKIAHGHVRIVRKHNSYTISRSILCWQMKSIWGLVILTCFKKNGVTEHSIIFNTIFAWSFMVFDKHARGSGEITGCQRHVQRSRKRDDSSTLRALEILYISAPSIISDADITSRQEKENTDSTIWTCHKLFPVLVHFYQCAYKLPSQMGAA